MIVDVSSGVNPWMPAPGPEEDEATASGLPAPTAPAVELGPQQGTVVAPADGLGSRALSVPRGTVCWVGAHGGAGESTLELLMPGSLAMGHAWPRVTEAVGEGGPDVVLVARTDARGLRAAQLAATQWAAGGVAVRLVGLVLIADAAGRLPRPLRDFSQVVAGGVPHVWQIPWVQAWRLGDPVTAATTPSAVVKVLDQVRRAVDTEIP